MNNAEEIVRFKILEPKLACPACAASLLVGEKGITCTGCGSVYPVYEGIPLMAKLGTPAAAREEKSDSGESSDPYQQQYQEVAEATEYNTEYKEKFLKRMSTSREYRLLRHLLSSQGRTQTLLDVPSGGGRLSAQMAEFTDLLIDADIARGQVLYGRKNGRVATQQLWMTASAFHLPFRDNSIDATVCCRLCHHLPTRAEREALVAELLRVSRRFVIMTFFDYRSFKNLLRRVRRPFNGQPPKMTMKIEEVEELARRGGARLVEAPYLSPVSSGHRYALMVKSGAGT